MSIHLQDGTTITLQLYGERQCLNLVFPIEWKLERNGRPTNSRVLEVGTSNYPTRSANRRFGRAGPMRYQLLVCMGGKVHSPWT
jgi:hypothetical protein